eukprot:superscaffoldBa00000121_g1759
MFPSFHSPDDPDTGVRAASQPFLNPLIPTGAPDVTLLSKTIGGPYRHEILETPNRIRRKAAVWTGEHGFLNHAKPLKGDGQVFYPTPPNIVLPNPKLRDWNFTLSERTSNMLKNMERTHWVTSYQMHYTEGKELPRSISNPCILPRPPVLPGIRPVGRAGTVGRGGAALSLLDLQDSFSKSEAHRNFNSSSTRAAVNLRDNIVTGKKHDFYGINCFYLHG